MSEMERRMKKTEAICFLENWREYLKANKLKKAEGFFMGGWSTNDDSWCVEVLNQMSRKEFEIIIKYPIWM